MIKRLRRLLTRGAFDPQEVDLNKVVRDVVRIASAQAAAHDVTLDSNLAQQPLRVNGDKVQLQQVVLNLIVNGIDAIAEMPNGVREIACRSWAVRRTCTDLDPRYRAGHTVGPTGAAVRAVLYHEAGWHGHGPLHCAYDH